MSVNIDFDQAENDLLAADFTAEQVATIKQILSDNVLA